MKSSDVVPQVILNNCISIKAAANYCGYNLQYLRRLLRTCKSEGLKIDQVRLIDKDALEAILEKDSAASDWRFGPKYFFRCC